MIARLWRALLSAASVRFWAMVGAAMTLTLFAVWLVWIVWRGGWPIRQAGRQLDILGMALCIALVGILAVVIALTGRHVEASGVWGRLDVSGGDDAHTPPTVTTTTKTEVKP